MTTSHQFLLLAGCICLFQSTAFRLFNHGKNAFRTNKQSIYMNVPIINGVFLRSFDLQKAKEFYGEGGIGLRTSFMDDSILKVDFPSLETSVYFKEDKECILNRPPFEWEDDFSEEEFQNLLKDVEAGPYAEYISEEDRNSGFKELDLEREYINARAYADGTGYFGIGVTLPNTNKIFNGLIEKDHHIIRLPGTYFFGASLIPDEDEKVQNAVKYGVAADPDEYVIEVNEQSNPHTPQAKVVLCVLDAEASTDFYTKILGFDLLRKRYNLNNRPRAASCSVYVGDKDHPERAQLELQYRFATEKLEHGVGFDRITLSLPELETIEKRLQESSISYTKGPSNIQFQDINGYQITIIKSNR